MRRFLKSLFLGGLSLMNNLAIEFCFRIFDFHFACKYFQYTFRFSINLDMFFSISGSSSYVKKSAQEFIQPDLIICHL